MLAECPFSCRVCHVNFKTECRRDPQMAAAAVPGTIDATFERAADRSRIAAIARDVGVDFQGLWLDVDPAEMLRRVAARRNDPSDATTAIVRQQLARDPGDIDWERIDGNGEPEPVAEAARRAVDARARLVERSRPGRDARDT